MYSEPRRTSEKVNTIQEFTVQFWEDWLSVDSMSLPVGQVSADVLNLSDETLLELHAKGKAFVDELYTKLYNPDVKKDLALVAAAQDKMNEVWDALFDLPLFQHMDLDKDYARNLLPMTFEHHAADFAQMLAPHTFEHEVFQGLVRKFLATADELIAFRSYISTLLDFNFERLKRRDAQSYAVSVYDFFRNTQILNEIAAALPPQPVFTFRQARSAMIEYVTMPHPEDERRYVIAERMVFDSLGAFLHVDFFRGLMQGNAPRRCHNCGKFFLLTKGYNTCYCNNIAPGETERTCRKVGAHKKATQAEGKTPEQLEYAKVYNRLKTRKCRGTISSDEWNAAVALALEYKDKAERGAINEFELKRVFGEM